MEIEEGRKIQVEEGSRGRRGLNSQEKFWEAMIVDPLQPPPTCRVSLSQPTSDKAIMMSYLEHHAREKFEYHGHFKSFSN